MKITTSGPALTVLDLHLSAHASALKSLDLKTPFDVETHSLADFTANNNDPADWEAWKAAFNQHRSDFLVNGAKQSPGVIAKAKADALAKTTATSPAANN